VEHLLASGFSTVRCLVRSERKFLEGLPVSIVRGDLQDTEALARGVRGADYVFHSAALTRSTEWDDFQRANVEGTQNLLRAIRAHDPGVRRVLITSSLAVIGRCDHAVATEDDPLQPISMYGRSKMLMEQVVAGFIAELPIVVVRPPAVYGPRESDIYTFFRSVSRGVCPIVGSGRDPSVSLVHARDLVRGMTAAVRSESTVGNTYFLGSPDRYSWHEVRDASATALRRRVLTIPVPPALVGAVGAVSEWVGKLTGAYPALNREKAREIRSACKMCDHTRATNDFGYTPRIDLWTGVQETIDWYRSAGWL
jgi:nucleoside-diphosphate-sugar epimerase